CSAVFRRGLEILCPKRHAAAASQAHNVRAGGLVSPAMTSQVAAFFDVDGTLVPFPTLEKRLVRALLYRHAIPLKNLAWWPAEWTRLLPRGFAYALQANKWHLGEFPVQRVCNVVQQITAPPQLWFFPQAVDRIAWHASQAHNLVLVTGTLQPLARTVARSLVRELASRGFAATIFVCATALAESSGQFTGRPAGEPMFGRAKAVAVRALAERLNLKLGSCYAYGDSAHDRWLLESVGYPQATNPSPSLRRLALRNGWLVEDWSLPGS